MSDAPAAAAAPVADRDAAGAGGRGDPEHAWMGTWPWWHAAFALAGAVAGVLAVVGPGTGRERLAALALLGAIVAAYAIAGRRVVGPQPVRFVAFAAVYAVVALPAFAAMVILSPGAFALLFVLYPQTFAIARTMREAALPALALTAAMAVGTARWHDPPYTAQAWVQSIVQGVVLGAFSVGMGTFVHRIIDQSVERAQLIAELRAARAELDRAHHDAGVLAERERLAHEIHDTLAQGFTSIVLLAQAARAAASASAPAAAGDDPARVHLDAIERTARENLGEARALVAELAPPSLAAGSLPAAAGRLVERIGVEVGLDARLTVTGAARSLGPDRDVALLRALQEALANVRRHAAAHRVDVTLDYGDDATTLTVRDDGCGFDPGSATNGFGLGGMRARLGQVGGSADVRSAPHEGTLVRVWIGPAANGDGPGAPHGAGPGPAAPAVGEGAA